MTVGDKTQMVLNHDNSIIVKPRLHDTTRCQTGLYRVYKHSAGCQIGLTTGCSVVEPVGQPAASCKQTSNRLYNRFDNRLYRANGL